MISVVAARYAKALADVVGSADPEQIVRQLRVIEAMIDESSELKNALASPAVPPARKRAVIARLAEPLGLSPQVRNFLYVVIDHRRALELKAMIESFENLAGERLGYVGADVASAQALSAPQQVALEVQLSRLAGKKAKLRFTIDPALMAGVVAKVGSTVYDGSVRGQLERLRIKLGSQ
jgi:F-type H+-transporting ATPase subunit delta